MPPKPATGKAAEPRVPPKAAAGPATKPGLLPKPATVKGKKPGVPSKPAAGQGKKPGLTPKAARDLGILSRVSENPGARQVTTLREATVLPTDGNRLAKPSRSTTAADESARNDTTSVAPATTPATTTTTTMTSTHSTDGASASRTLYKGAFADSEPK